MWKTTRKVTLTRGTFKAKTQYYAKKLLDAPEDVVSNVLEITVD